MVSTTSELIWKRSLTRTFAPRAETSSASPWEIRCPCWSWTVHSTRRLSCARGILTIWVASSPSRTAVRQLPLLPWNRSRSLTRFSAKQHVHYHESWATICRGASYGPQAYIRATVLFRCGHSSVARTGPVGFWYADHRRLACGIAKCSSPSYRLRWQPCGKADQMTASIAQFRCQIHQLCHETYLARCSGMPSEVPSERVISRARLGRALSAVVRRERSVSRPRNRCAAATGRLG
jgi:hypothetical protein